MGDLWGLYESLWGFLCPCGVPMGDLWGPYESLWGSLCPCGIPMGDLWVPLGALMCPSGGSMGLCVPVGDLCVPMCPYVSLHTAGGWNSMSSVGLCNPGLPVILWVSMCPCGIPMGDLWGPYESL